MKFLVYIFFLFFYQVSFSQDHFVSSIGIGNTNQFTRQYLYGGNNFILTTQSHCIDYEGSCGGILRVNLEGEILDTFLSQDFSSNLNALYIDNDEYFYSGEYKMGSASALSILKLDRELDLVDSYDVKQVEDKYYNYFATSSYKVNDKHTVIASSFCDPDCPQVSHLFSFENDQLDTSLVFSFVNSGYTVAGSSMKSSKEEIVIYFRYRDFDTNEDSIKIIKLDTNFNLIFEWSHEVIDNSIPRGCVTTADNMIITVPSDDFLGFQEVWSVASDGEVNWKYNWPSSQGSTNIIRIEEVKNGDVLVMGQLRNPLLEDKRNVAFVMRLNSNGVELWRRYFKLEDQHNLLSNYIADLIELDDGDLLLTGQTKRIYYDPITGEDYPNQDILWARIGGDGCINDDCSEVYTITSTDDQLIDPNDQIDIYPNPIQDNTLTIEVNKGDAQAALIYGLDGQLIKSADLTYGVNILTLVTNSSILFIRIINKTGQLLHSEKVLRL